MLKKSEFIWEFSLCNILKYEENINLDKVRYFPMPFFYNNTINNNEDNIKDNIEFDILFYGHLNLRRKLFLEEIGKKYNIKILTLCYGEEKEEYIIRMPLKIEEDGSLMLSAEIPERENINLMIGDKNSALAATREACLEALESIPKSKIKFAMVFSDVARLHLLRKDSQKESEIIKKILGEDVPFFGCYTYSEYGPFYIKGYEGQSYLHNQAISIAIFSELL